MRRLPISPLLAPPFGCGLPWRPFCLGFEQIWEISIFSPIAPPAQGLKIGPAGFGALVILTRLALGAPRAGGLCGAGRGWALTKTMVPMRSRERPLGPCAVGPGHAPAGQAIAGQA